MKTKQLLFLLLLLSWGNQIFARDQVDYYYVEAATSRLFQEAKWDSLILVGKKALRNDIDYYYLRVRMGIAFFEKGQYILASDHLRRALEFNSGDPFTRDYLYRSLIRSNRYPEARSVSSDFIPSEKKALDIHDKAVDNIYAEGGYTFSSNNKPLQNPDLMGTAGIYGETDLYENYYYAHAQGTFNLAHAMNLTFGYSYLNFSKRKYFQYSRVEDRLDSTVQQPWGYSNYYSFQRKTQNIQVPYRIDQHQLYLSSTIVLPGKYKLTPTFHLIYVKESIPMARYSQSMVMDTVWKDTTGAYAAFPFQRTDYSVSNKDTSFYNYLFSLALTRDIGIFNTGIRGSISNLNGKNQTQVDWTLTYYPLGNLNLYGTTSISGFFAEDETRILFQQVIGVRLWKYLWLEGNVLIGDFTNASTPDGFVVYNNSDRIRYRLGANITIIISRHVQMNLVYQYFEKESMQLYYSRTTDGTEMVIQPETKYNPYHTNTIIGGITWKL